MIPNLKQYLKSIRLKCEEKAVKEKSFLKHFMVIGGGTLLNMIVGFITTPIITRIVGTDEYGQYSIFTMYTSIALMVLCMGLDQALIRFYYHDTSTDYQKTILKKCWQLPVIICITLGLILNLLCYTGIVQMEFDNFVVTMMTVCVLFQILNRLDLILLRVSYKTNLYSMLQVGYKVGFAGLVLIGAFVFRQNYFYIMVVATVISYIGVTVAGILAQKNLWNFWNIKEKHEINNKELYMYAFPFIISMGITTFFQAIDKISLNYYCTYSDVGIYSSAMTLVHIFAIIQTTFNALWAPMATEHYEKAPDDKEFHQRGNRIITLVMFFIGLSLILIKDVFALLLGADYREAAYILPFLIFNPIMYTISETTVVGIVFMKKSKMHIVIASLACIVNIVGNTLLVPVYGCRGAAISTGIAYIIFYVARTLIANHYYPVKWGLTRFWIITIVSLVYAWYNTFYSFSIISVVGYVAAEAILFILYRDAINETIIILKTQLPAIIKKRKKG